MTGAPPPDHRVPPAFAGMRIGLFGGSFNPPHRGHVHVAETALARLRLDRLWIMVTPGNPLKDRTRLPPIDARIAAVRSLIRDPRILVTGLEAGLGSPFSWHTVKRLKAAYPQTRFVWVMGGDNLAGFHRWQAWWRLAHAFPMAVIDRPGATVKSLRARAAIALDHARLPERLAPVLAECRPPAWIYVHAPRVALSSTQLRAELQTKGKT